VADALSSAEVASATRQEHALRSTRGTWALSGLIARVLVGGLFVATGIVKIANPAGFAEEIQDYQLAPIALTNAAALVMPWLEVLAGGLLIAGLWRFEARCVIVFMLLVFTVVKVYAFLSGKGGSCGCGGDVAALNTLLDNPQGIFTNLVMLGLLGLDWLAQRKVSAVSRTASHA
jgi:uncharacterized membrane protein YphA (DoxX/SURF4 family)